MSIYVWKHFGDRWSFSFIDVTKCFDAALNYQRKNCDLSTEQMKLTAVCVYPKQKRFLAVGDNQGYIRVFQISSETASLVATHQLSDPDPSDTIKAMYITQNE